MPAIRIWCRVRWNSGTKPEATFAKMSLAKAACPEAVPKLEEAFELRHYQAGESFLFFFTKKNSTSF